MKNMKKAVRIILSAMMILSLAGCGSEKKEATTQAVAEDAFRPALDTSASCSIRIAGGYDNFEALETEFDRFNKYYPNVELVYTKVDDYNNMIGTVLDGNDAPDIYVNYSSITPGCMAGISTSPPSIMPRIWQIPHWDWILAVSAAISS